MALAANDAADRVDQLIILTERLTDVVAEQCRCLEQHRPQDAAGVMEEAKAFIGSEHLDVGLQGAGGLDGLQDRDHVARGDAEGVEARHQR